MRSTLAFFALLLASCNQQPTIVVVEKETQRPHRQVDSTCTKQMRIYNSTDTFEMTTCGLCEMSTGRGVTEFSPDFLMILRETNREYTISAHFEAVDGELRAYNVKDPQYVLLFYVQNNPYKWSRIVLDNFLR